MKEVFFILVIILSGSGLIAQVSVNAGGSDMTGSGGEASFTIGQIDYVYINGPAYSFDQGVQQAYEISEVLSVGSLEYFQAFTVFPVPSNDVLNIVQSDGFMLNNWSCQIYDLRGNLIYSSTCSSKSLELNLFGFAAGQYYLRVTDNKNLSEVYKLIKL